MEMVLKIATAMHFRLDVVFAQSPYFCTVPLLLKRKSHKSTLCPFAQRNLLVRARPDMNILLFCDTVEFALLHAAVIVNVLDANDRTYKEYLVSSTVLKPQ